MKNEIQAVSEREREQETLQSLLTQLKPKHRVEKQG